MATKLAKATVRPANSETLVPAQLAFFELQISREKGMRLLLTRELAGERIGRRWFVHRASIDALRTKSRPS